MEGWHPSVYSETTAEEHKFDAVGIEYLNLHTSLGSISHGTLGGDQDDVSPEQGDGDDAEVMHFCGFRDSEECQTTPAERAAEMPTRRARRVLSAWVLV